jgi:hypothetical protein
MLGDGGAGGHLSSVGPCCPSLVLAVRAALAQQDPSVTLDWLHRSSSLALVLGAFRLCHGFGEDVVLVNA